MNSRSPWPLLLLDRLLPDDLRHLTGDLEEEYRRSRISAGSKRALLRLCRQIIRSLPFFLGQTLKWNAVMILHYLKTGLRIVRKHLSFSLINMLGLAASMAVCLLILLFIVDQKSYDRFHPDHDRIYRVISTYDASSSQSATRYATSPASLARILEEEVPGVQEAVHIRSTFSGEFRHGENTLALGGLYASSDFFRLFGFELLAGNPETVLEEPRSIVLTPENARRLFGDAPKAVGRSITAMGDRTYTVTGILDTGVKTHMDIESLVSYPTLQADSLQRARAESWTRSIYNSYTYLRLEEGAEKRLREQLPGIIDRHFTHENEGTVLEELRLQPITGISLGPALSNEIGMVVPELILWFLVGFAAVVLAIACFNYVSLTVARGLTRSKEVGVRKVLGAYRSNILKQFLTESVLIALLSLFFAVLILSWLLPQFNNLMFINFTENQIGLDLLADFGVYGLFFVFSVLVGLLAGFYPAWRFTSFQPAGALRGSSTAGRGSQKTLKKAITISQFTVSIIFIITTIILLQQFRHMSRIDYGFDYEQVVNVELQDVPYERFKQAMGAHPQVLSLSAANVVPALGSKYGVWLESDSVSGSVSGSQFTVTADYPQSMGLHMEAGRFLQEPGGSGSGNEVVLNEEAVRALGLGGPQQAVGAAVTLGEKQFTVVGVIGDFITSDPLAGVEPAAFHRNPDMFQYAVVKVREEGSETFTDDLESAWPGLDSHRTPKYERYAEQISNNPTVVVFRDFVKVFGLVAVFSIAISCLGLLGMAMYSAENRVKEIGVRKVLGATRQQIVYLLSREYLIMIAIAILIATPIAWLANNFWLSFVAVRITPGPVIFLVGILGCSALALTAIASQALRAARVKVVDNLRSE